MMKETKYTPKRLLSLILALVMLLGMLPTAVLAEDANTLKSGVTGSYGDKLTFRAWSEVPADRTYFVGDEVDVTVHYELLASSKATSAIITELSSFNLDFRHIPSESAVLTNVNESTAVTADGFSDQSKVTTNGEAKAFLPGTVIASGSFVLHNRAIEDYRATGIDDCYGSIQLGVDYTVSYKAIDGGEEKEFTSESSTLSTFVNYVPLGYAVSFAAGTTDDVTGMPETVYTASKVELEDDVYFCEIPNVKPERKGYDFVGWKVDNSTIVQPGATLNVTADTRLTALWTEKVAGAHVVTFDVGAGAQVTGVTYTDETNKTVTVADGKSISFRVAAADGYDAADLTVMAGGELLIPQVVGNTYYYKYTPEEDVTLTVSADAEKYTVSFDVAKAGAYPTPMTQNVNAGEMAVKPTVEPKLEGWEFRGWYLGNQPYTFEETVTKNITLTAQWARAKVQVTLEKLPEGVESAELVGVAGGAGNAMSDVSADIALESEVTLKVQWTEGYAPATVLANGLPLAARTNGDTYYYTFTVNKETTIRIDAPQLKKFTVTLPQGNGYTTVFGNCTYAGSGTGNAEGMSSYTFTWGDTFTIQLTAQADTTAKLFVNGATEEGWTATGGTITTEAFTVNQDYNVSVSATQKIVRTVIYTLLPHSGQYTTQFVDDGTTATAPKAPEITGYDFGGWYTTPECSEADKWNFGTPVTANMVLYGKLTAKTFKISYDANKPAEAGDNVTGMPAAATPKTYGASTQLDTAKPALTGYTFKGWANSKNGPVAYQPGETFSTELDQNITLYAVWEINTFTVTLPAGAGYSTVPSGVNTVEYNKSFSFTLNVDRAYAAKKPVVTYKAADAAEGTAAMPLPGIGRAEDNKAASWTYTIDNVTENLVVSIQVTPNTIYTVKFFVSKDGKADAEPFVTQSVEHGYYASMPVAPELEGYTFEGYYQGKEKTSGKFNFDGMITADTSVYAYYARIKPVIKVVKTSGDGWALTNWKEDDKPRTLIGGSDPKALIVDYGADVTFDLVVEDGYDWSGLSVSANGYALTREGDVEVDANAKQTTIHFRLSYVMANTRIAVSGIQRKTVTITYNANSLDHVAGMPEQQVINYYVNGKENTRIIKQLPVRTGYTFLGWSTDSSYTGTGDPANGEQFYKWADIEAQNEASFAKFTADTTLYAVWAAQKQSVKLVITDEFLDHISGTSHYGALEYAYEGDKITLVGELKHDAQGTMTFYKRNRGAAAADAWTYVGSVSINGGKYGVFNTTVEAYRWDSALTAAAQSNYRWDYKVAFVPTENEGYTSCDDTDDLRVYSKAISWKVNKKVSADAWTNAENTLSVYSDEARTKKATQMTADKTYWLEIPAIYELDGGLNLKNDHTTKLNVGEHYEITWEYKDANGDWQTYAVISDRDWVKVTPEYSGYVFRAKAAPTVNSIYTKAAKYDEAGTVVKNEYWDYLITKETAETERKETRLTLAVDAPEEEKTVLINGETPFAADHLAQFEGQEITLIATVTKENTNAGVETGKVMFYRQVEGGWALIDTVDVQTSGDDQGKAALTYVMPAYDADKTALTNMDVFRAVYVQNETYVTSAADGNTVYIKSAKLKTPVIMDMDGHTGVLKNDAGEGQGTGSATTYDWDLTELLAGIEHKMQLRTDETKQDWSVVALDGRKVADGNYSIEWQVKTGANFVKSGTDAPEYTAKETKTGDRYHAVLTGKNEFAGSSATSRDIVIGKLQDVVVTVTAIDAIEATDETHNPDVYQRNEIELQATVTAKDEKATSQPTGLVGFYYVAEDDSFVALGKAEILKGADGQLRATIKTDKLPVDAMNYTALDVTVTAVYYGNETFNPSKNWEKDATATEETWKITKAAVEGYVIPEVVTVYSSVVFDCEHENQVMTVTTTEKGIHIKATDGVMAVHEKNVVLTLGDVYTLDRENALANVIAKLDADKDYTVKWQKLNGATYIKNGDYSAAEGWTDIEDAVGTKITLKEVEQNTAYRAVITIKNPATPIVKGSFLKVDQGEFSGRHVYYSNVLTTESGKATISVGINTNKVGKTGENLEGITLGETMTANVFVSGAVSATPHANVTVTITNDAAKGNDVAYTKTLTNKNTVNGWNAFDWDTRTGDDSGEETAPGFYTMTVTATSNTGYQATPITRSLIVRENRHSLTITNREPVYNGRTQGVVVALNGFEFRGEGIQAAAERSWTVKYYEKNDDGTKGAMVEPTQAGKYIAVVTLPASAYWTEVEETVDFEIKQRAVSVADVIAQAKVYDGSKNANLVEVILNDAQTEQGSTGWLKADEMTGVINGDSIFATATGTLDSEAAGKRTVKVTDVKLGGADAGNYVWSENEYSEPLYVARSQVYGETATLSLKQGEQFPAEKVIAMIDQAGNKLEASQYSLTFYYHSDEKIEKVNDCSKLGHYTVVARPDQANYKSGITMKFDVVEGETQIGTLNKVKASTLMTIRNTTAIYGEATGVTVDLTNGAEVETIEYLGGSDNTGAKVETDASKLDAGRYIVKVTAKTGDVAYGIYTVAKARPVIGLQTADVMYDSTPKAGYTSTEVTDDAMSKPYFTWAGDIAIGVNEAKEGNVDEQAPVDAGTYTVTLHVNETKNFTAHEVSASYTVGKAPLTIKADSWQTTQYGAHPDMTASYDGLAGVDGDKTPDTSLRDVQIAPEFLYNPTDGKSNYSNDTLDQVGMVAVQPIDALSKNYELHYVDGQYTKQRDEANMDLDIHGLPENASDAEILVYYGDEIQLYPYGYYVELANGSSLLTWKTKKIGGTGDISIDAGNMLKIDGVGTFEITLIRGKGTKQISKTVHIRAIQKEVRVAVPDQDYVYKPSAAAAYDKNALQAFDLEWRTVNAPVTAKVVLQNTTRQNIGTQLVEAPEQVLVSYQYRTYDGKLTVNDLDATVAPVGDTHTYGELRTVPTEAYTSTQPGAVTNGKTASQTDSYNRLDQIEDEGYEILVAATENLNYNVSYTTDLAAQDSRIRTYEGMTLTSKADALNDVTVYGEEANILKWVLADERTSDRKGEPYADNLADFDLPTTFVYQEFDKCVGNADCTSASDYYKAANRVVGNTAVLPADRTADPKTAHPNYTLLFTKRVENSGKALKALNYQLTDDKIGNRDAASAPYGTLGYSGGAAALELGENFIEGSANISQRPIKLENVVNNVQVYWKLPQSQLAAAFRAVLKAEENSTGRGLAKGHTIRDLDLTFQLKVGSKTFPIDPESGEALGITDTDLTAGNKATVIVRVGDTNYKLEGNHGDQFEFDITLKVIRIQATYYNKTFTGFDVRIQVVHEDGTTSPLQKIDGLTFKVLKEKDGVLDMDHDYATGKNFYYVGTSNGYGIFHGSYNQLPLLGNGEVYVFQMYEYGVPLLRK